MEDDDFLEVIFQSTYTNEQQNSIKACERRILEIFSMCELTEPAERELKFWSMISYYIARDTWQQGFSGYEMFWNG